MTEVEAPLEPQPQPESPPDPHASTTWIVAVATGAIVLGIMLRVGAVLCPNDASRWDTVWSLVEKGTYIIDEPPWGTIDKVHRDGHDYSSKIPLLPTMLAGEYWVIKKVTKWAIQEKTERVTRIILFTLNIIPLIIYVVLIGRLIGRYAQNPWWRSYWLVAAALGTYVTGYSVTLNDHSVGAWSALFAFYPAVRILYADDRRRHMYALAGFFTAFTACNQLPAAVFAVALFGWLIVRQPKRTALFFIPAALVPIAGFLITTYVSTGGFVPYYLYKNSEIYQYEGSYWSNPTGIDALDEPKHVYLFNCLLGHHGFFTLTPIFILSVVSFVTALRSESAETKGLAWFVLIVSVLTLTLNVWKTNNYGGVCQGFRYLIWPVPLWITVGSLRADAYGGARWVKVIAVLFLFVSVVSMGCCTDNPWSESWLEQFSKHLAGAAGESGFGQVLKAIGWGTY